MRAAGSTSVRMPAEGRTEPAATPFLDAYSAACMSPASMKPPDWRRHSAA
jgi:hypothetical protein